MDIAKYMVTAILLSSIFSDISSSFVMYFAIITALLTLFWGLWLIGDEDNKTKNKKKKKSL